jgi:CheY-like chemotaxis protein
LNTPTNATQKLKILVVEDNKDSATTMARALQTVGYEVVIACNAQDALKFVADTSPHVVLIDIGLPGINGYELARCLNQDRLTSEPLLIAVTGYSRDEDRQKSADAGIDHHLVKPVDFERLHEILEQFRQRIRSRR